MKAALHRFIASFGQDGDFEALALALHQHQRKTIPDLARMVVGDAPTRWFDIPAVPVWLFRVLPLTAFPPEEAVVVFRTSGTTGGRGVVRLRDTTLYDLGARAHAERVVGPIPNQGGSLVARLADSSLAHMCWSFAPALRPFFDLEGGVDGAGLRAWLAALSGPVFVPGTAFAFAALLEQRPAPLPLAAGSVLMVTGGFKGRRVSVEEGALADGLRALFPGARVVGEYGMSELSSQLWSAAVGEPFQPPPWLRVMPVDPGSGRPAREGLLRFFDLASLDTPMAIETGDLGELLPDGRLRLLGRHPGAPLRGCSLTVEEALRPPTPDLAPTPAGCPEPFNDPGPDPALDADRVVRVMAALGRLRQVDPTPLSQGLTAENAHEGLDRAISAIQAPGLLAELATPGRRPRDLLLVVAWGVFTSPLEWVCLYAAAGIAVRIKAPRRDPAFCEALAQVFSAEGLPVQVQTDRDLGAPDAVVAFGSDAGVAEVVAATPGARHLCFGHRFSAVLCDGSPVLAQVLAWEQARYDSRGCMAPVALFVLGDPTPLFDALVEAMPLAEFALPRAPLDPALGPEWRRRLCLARATGRVVEGEGWALAELPAEHFTPVALPRLVTLHRIDDAAHLERILDAWRPWLSSLAVDDLRRPLDHPDAWGAVHAWFPRVVMLGSLQQPRMPRRHDGQPMLGGVLDPVGS